ncbi:hypothetical protein ANN_07429 [Periplaneta americana]|uniref:Uncharacterized protein n=1 Tax=Periplaneta americana TaxID=6978 RepID=A0ABQ8T074_PERAM|nr:hypothetical protein ANN_07429 [Periplaneta americana]
MSENVKYEKTDTEDGVRKRNHIYETHYTLQCLFHWLKTSNATAAYIKIRSLHITFGRGGTTREHVHVETLVMPHFNYSDSLLTDLNVNQSQRLQRVHNSCVRFVCDVRRADHITPSFQTLNWLRLNERRNFHSLVLLFQVLHTSTPTYLASRFSYLSSYHNLFTRTQNSRILAIPTHKTSSYSSSYTISLSRLWNTLPSDIRDCRNLVAFKSKLIKHFLTA